MKMCVSLWWLNIRLIAALFSGVMFGLSFRLANKIPRDDPKARRTTGKGSKRQGRPSDTSWPTEIVSTRRR